MSYSYEDEASEIRQKNRLKRRMKKIKYSIIILFILLIGSCSAITHKFGPYKGKVVDLETGEPLEGAVVLMRFRTDGFEGSGTYAGAVETLTDSDGEFNISAKRVFVFHFLNQWNPNGYVTIFKPGYGVYPGHIKALPRFEIGGTLPENYYVTIRLPKLETMEERSRNLDHHELMPSIPDRKMRNLLKLRSQELVNLGFGPLPSKRLGE